MTDYTVTTDFSAKDSLTTGDPEKTILGSDVDAEFDNIATAIATKKNSAYQGALVWETTDSTQATSGASSGAAITWDTESYDTDSIHSTSTNTERLTVPSGVTRVRLHAQLLLKVTSGTEITAYFRKNGSNSFAGNSKNVTNTGATTYETRYLETPVITVSATDYFDVFIISDDDAVTVSHDGVGVASWFAMEIVE